jgi:hypothetical protein
MRASSARLQPKAILVSNALTSTVRGMVMRLALAASSLYLCLSAVSVPAESADAQQSAAPAASTIPVANAAGAASANDAAAKHAKRTACLQEAKTKKLLGADKTAFLKSCNAAE